MIAGRTLEHDWFPSTVPDNVVVGEGSWLYSSFAFVQYAGARGMTIGNNTGVYQGSIFDIGPDGDVHIGDYVSLGSAVISTNSRVSIGDFSLISFQVVIADNPYAVPWSSRAAIEGQGSSSSDRDVIIGDNVWIGARSVILGGARLGEGAIVGAFSVVDSEVPPFSVVVGNPAHIVGTKPPASPDRSTP